MSKLIDNFMGVTHVPARKTPKAGHSGFMREASRDYSEWQYLMPVVEQIESTINANGYHPNVEILGTFCRIEWDSEIIAECDGLIKADVILFACTKFVEYFNKQAKEEATPPPAKEGYCKIRADLIKDDTMPSLLKGWPDQIGEGLDPVDASYRYTLLEKDTEEGYNMVIWHPGHDFVDLANSIDFEF
jgi:hypothetical protein